MRDRAVSEGPELNLRGLEDAFVSRAHVVAQRVEESILGRDLAPGHHLGTKSQLQKELGVAFGTLNEAVRVLQMRGLIEVRPGPGGGVFVATDARTIRVRHGILSLRNSARSVEEAIAVRNALEELVAIEAAVSHEASDIHGLYERLDEMAANVDDAPAFVRANWAVHRQLAECGSNTVLASVYGTLMDFIEDSLEAVIDKGSGKASEATLRTHRALVDAVATRDPQRAAQAARDHAPWVQRLGDGCATPEDGRSD